jgi:ABC-type lipoprotein export system ATPase subunit
MLKTKSLKFSYTANDHLEFPDISCKAGEHWLMLGQSGSGKTTLLHLLAGLRRPKDGSVILNKTVVSELSASQLDRFRGKHIGIVFQESHFVRSLSVQENLALAQRLAGSKANPNRIHSILEQLNVAHKLHSKPDRLSVGEQQRVAIARAVINQPSIILADEPSSALDDMSTEKVIHLLKEQAASVNAILMIVTHDNRLKTQFDKQIQL